MFKKPVKRLFSGSIIFWVITCFILSWVEINPKAVDLQGVLPLVRMNFASAAEAAPLQTPPPWPHEKSDLKPDAAILYGRLENGLRYALMRNTEPRDRVSIHLNVQAGSMYETDDQQGLAHFLEHMLFNGSTHFKPGELVKYFQSIGMNFGADANAHTGFYETVYDILLPKGDAENLANGLIVISDYAQGALLLPSEIERERRVVLAEKRSRDSASYRTFEAIMQFEFPEAALSKRLPIGTEAVLKEAPPERLKAFYDTWYRPEQMVLVMVGDFDIETAQNLIRERFADMAPRAPPKAPMDFGEIRHAGITPFYHFEKELGNTSVGIETVQKVKPQADSIAYQKEQIISHVANQIIQNRLDALGRTQDAPFTEAGIYAGTYLHQVKQSDISAETGPDIWQAALAAIEQALRKALRYGFTESELERVKKNYLAQLDTAVSKASTRSSTSLARQIIRNVNADRVFQSPAQEKALFAPFIDTLTLKEVHAAFKALWYSDHRLVVVTGNADLRNQDQSPRAIIAAAYAESRKQAVTPPVEKAAKAFPYLPTPEKSGTITERRDISDLGIVQVDFENGLRLNLKQTDFKADEVQVKLSFGRGVKGEPVDKPGLATLAASVINESGLGGLDQDELERALAGKNTTVYFTVAKQRFSYQGVTIKKEVPLLFALLYAHLTDPAFRSDAYTRTLKRFDQQYRAWSASIDGAMLLSGNRFLAGGDVRFGLPPWPEFKNLTLQDVRTWVTAAMGRIDMEVSVVGDMDIDQTIDLAARYLGSLSLKVEASPPETRPGPQFPHAKSHTVTVETKIPKGLVVVAYETADGWDIRRNRRLSIMAEVLSERMRDIIREKLGASYSPFAYNRGSRAYPGYGVLRAMVNVDPARIESVVKTIKEIVADLVQNGVDEKELERALKPVLTEIKDMRRSNRYWLESVLSGSKQYPQQLQWSRNMQADYAAINADEVAALARRYLHNQKAAVIRIAPREGGGTDE